MPPQASQLAGSAVTYSATATGGVNVRYKWKFGDGTPETGWATSPAVVHTFTGPGIYFVTLTVTDDLGVPNVQRSCRPSICAPRLTPRGNPRTSPTRRAPAATRASGS